jgi:tetratricopeptide (TPR) repeat protein
LLKGDFVQAEESYRKMLESEAPSDQRDGREFLCNLYLSQGKFERLKIEADELGKLGDSYGRIYWRALANIERGNIQQDLEVFNKIAKLLPVDKIYFLLKSNMIEEAEKALEDYKVAYENASNQKLVRRIILHFQAEIEMRRGNYPKAIDYSKEAIYLLSYQKGALRLSLTFMDSHAWFMRSLAQAYYKNGDVKEARREYEKITELTTGRLFEGDIYAKSFYMLGKIHEQKGEKELAIANYEKFLDLWKDADPGLPEVEETKAKLASLKN